ncbi:MAG: hypothetical protein JJE44_11350 [Flavobacteriaceae bacterium]|nr:hypothetical protein [Flavobacteriaceae bacterium]
MEKDKKEIRPITNLLGLAIFDSQRLEYTIAFMMLLVNNELNFTSREHDEKINNYMLNLSKKTLGTLISQLKKLINVSDGFSERLEEALDARNYLTHRFFNHQVENLLTVIGRKEALELVKEKRELLYQCNFFLDPFVQALIKLRGFTPEMFTDKVSEKYEHEE